MKTNPIKIDKSVFNEEELKTYEALIAKASVAPEVAEEEMEKEKPASTAETKKEEKEEDGVVKSAEIPEIAAALERLTTLEKSIEMNEFTEIAKKYAPLGEKEDELADTLYAMKKSSEENYNAYIGVLEKSLSLVEKSGVFAEIGKSASGATGNTVDKISAAADEIMKSDATITRDQAVAKAWIENPELVAEYEKEYNA